MAESEKHKRIKAQAVDYLRNKGYHIARHEVRDHYYGIIDAWGINPYTLNTMGIEVKVSRADFFAAKHKDRRADTQMVDGESLPWMATNEVFYACPEGLILPEEVCASTGLLWFRETDKPYPADGRFFNKKKPFFIKTTLKNKMQTLLNIYEPWHTSYT